MHLLYSISMLRNAKSNKNSNLLLSRESCRFSNTCIPRCQPMYCAMIVSGTCLQTCLANRTYFRASLCLPRWRLSTKTSSIRARPVSALLASSSADFAIIGGGPGGLACAAAIRVALGSDVSIKVRAAVTIACDRCL